MIAYLPELYPDELVYSWFCRYAVHSGNIGNRRTLQELYCKKSDYPSKEFIGNLNQKTKNSIEKIYSMNDMILCHTMYPQYARFLPLKKKKKTLYQLKHGNCDVHHLFSISPRCEQEQYLKYCPICAREDREQYGETYWHRKHQIRNLCLCPQHQCKLMDSHIPVKSMNTYTFYAAELNIPDTEKHRTEIVFENNPRKIQFANYMEQLFDSPIYLDNEIPIRAVLYHWLKKTPYMKSTGTCRYTAKFTEDMQGYYQDLALNSVASMSQIQRVLLSGTLYDFSVICQIAFFIGIPVEELIFPKLTDEEIEEEKSSHAIKYSSSVNWEQYDIEIASQLKILAHDIYTGADSKIGRPERVSERLIYKRLKIPSHRLSKMPRCKVILKEYEETFQETWARKLIWAYEILKMKRGKGEFYWCDIRQLSGVKKKYFEDVIPYLEEWADEDTVKELVTLVGGR